MRLPEKRNSVPNRIGVTDTAGLDTPPLAPGYIPWVGHIGPLLRDPIGFMSRLAAGPDLVTMRLGPRTMYVVNSLELLYEMLTERAEEFTQGVVFQKAQKVLGQGMIVSDGALHRKQRKLVQPTLRRAQVEKYTEAMVAAVEAFANSRVEHQPFDVVFEMHGVGLDVLCNALFGEGLSPEVADQVKRATPDVMAGVVVQALYPARWMEKVPIPVNRRFDSALPRMNRAVDEVIANHRARVADDGATGLQMLMEATDPETGRPMPDHQLHDEVINLIVAGTEAVGTMLAWFFHELAVNPGVQRRIVAEIDEIIGDGPMTVERLGRLGFTRAVVNETLRRHTPTWLLTRKAKDECELGGYRIPKDGEVVFSLTALHRDPELFDHPMRFDPDRWLDGRTDGLPRHAFIPFVVGKRKCLGDHFSRHAMLVTAVVMVRRWRLVHADGNGEDIRERALALVIPRDLIMRPERQRR